jgi:hypothetical protein
MSTPTESATPPVAPRIHVPGNPGPKLVYLCLSGIVLALGLWLAGEILVRLAWGESAVARVSEIRVAEPGEPMRSYRYRPRWVDRGEFRKIFSHYVDIPIDGRPVPFRISADSRRVPIEALDVNERVRVVYFPDDPHRVAYAPGMIRTWGMALLFFALGGTMFATALPLWLATGKPIELDPE